MTSDILIMRILLASLVLVFTSIGHFCMGDDIEDARQYYKKHPPIYFEPYTEFPSGTIYISACGSGGCLLKPLDPFAMDANAALQGLNSGDNQKLNVSIEIDGVTQNLNFIPIGGYIYLIGDNEMMMISRFVGCINRNGNQLEVYIQIKAEKVSIGNIKNIRGYSLTPTIEITPNKSCP